MEDKIPKQKESSCIRCGKERILKRKWKEILEKGTPIVHFEMVCPDRQCQKIVDDQFAAIRERRLLQENRKALAKI